MIRAASNGLILAVLAVFTWTGCQTRPQRDDLPQIYSVSVDNAPNVPIIDIHTHAFNARDIPVKHIALGRRDISILWIIPDRWASRFGALLAGNTQPEGRTNWSETEALQDAVTNQDTNMAVSVEKLQNSTMHRAIRDALADRENQKVHKTGPIKLPLGERIVLWLVAKYAEDESAGKFTGSETEYEVIRDFLYDLTRSDEALTGSQFYEENSSNIEFRIVHMMDMGPTYRQRGGEEAREFPKQIERMEELQRHDPAQFAYFVAYSPFRDNDDDGESMHYVMDALTKHHAYGVKVYPPAGYSMTENSIPKRPGTGWHKQPAEQWDSRYTKNGARITGAELDGRLMQLLTYCATNQIPIFVHCMNSEMQARSGYGEMANPRFWREALAANPILTNLRLCLGHAGGEEWWFGEPTQEPWGSDVYYLCTHYPNVYCEVGDLSGIFLTNNQSRFATNMLARCTTETNAEHPFAFGKKIMYGSDWFMPMAQSRKEFLKAFQQVFLWPKMQPIYYRLFFFENALNYLNARERINDTEFAIEPSVKNTLNRLLGQVVDP
jgi:hypothetical protein